VCEREREKKRERKEGQLVDLWLMSKAVPDIGHIRNGMLLLEVLRMIGLLLWT
jgi:hypothetical protein